MENKSHALAAGAFVLLLLGLLGGLATWLSRDNTEQRVYEISTAQSVSGLQPQAGVRYKGVGVGRVASIALDPQVRGNVLLRIAVSDATPVSSATWASLGYQGVTGLAFVQLEDDGNAAATPLPTSVSQPARIPLRAGLVARLGEQGTRLLGQLEEVGQRVNGLLAPQNQQQLMDAVGRLGQAAASLERLSRHADQVLAGTGPEGSASLPRVAQRLESSLQSMQNTSERLRESGEVVRASAADFRRTTTRMNEPGGTLDKIARASDALAATSASLGPRLNRGADEGARTLRQIGVLADGLAEQPQSLLLGRGAPAPGPGEPGFVSPPEK